MKGAPIQHCPGVYGGRNKALRHGLKSLKEVNCEAAKHKDEHLEAVQEKIGKLINRSLDYGKLKYEEKISNVFDTFEFYAADLHHRREFVGKEIKELNENIDEEKLMYEIKRTQEDLQNNTESKMDYYFNTMETDWRKKEECKKPENAEISKSNLSVEAQELKQRKVSRKERKESRIKTEKLSDLVCKIHSVAPKVRLQSRLNGLVDNTIVPLAYDDRRTLGTWLRYILAAGLTLAAVVIVLWPYFN